ncbi:putative PKS/NRPS-like protein biosynthetic cluster [Aspergillus pseudoviridinutans]|uniref:PKS/NRPS-like protein biosynthetic cluster n=1 Tax=Aspergillus pseudoviridinutans TaxID=1517512 RepID=A0A9P3BJW7_9EURO|nr:putative PKS/NRPS-like protein biosynthetic cluster [Aspergillus pseudoviridinutans]GIJ92472.1 putative PKS/NRPS-like protein biosynthetic cluster [Aspergillus pseudoviridinutans]
MEANLTMGDKSSLWLQASHQANRAAYRAYSFTSCDTTALVAAEEDYQSAKSVTFDLLDLAKTDVAPRDSKFDLVIAKRDAMTPELLANVARNSRALLADSGSFLAIETFLLGTESTDGVINGHTPFEHIPSIIREAGFTDVIKIPCNSVQWAYRCSVGSENKATPRGRIDVARLSDACDPILTRARLGLEVLGWTVVEHVFPFSHLHPGSPIVVLDEPSHPVLASVSPEQWDAIKEVTCNKRCPLLWVTVGSQFRVQQPDNALVHGFFRSIRAEGPSLRLTTLDVEEAESPTTTDAIDRILRRLHLPGPKSQVDNEYVERGGVIYISRIIVDDGINKVRTDRLNGADLQERSLHDLSTTARLQAERLGTLESFHYGEVLATELPVRDGCLEVEIYAAGLNFKDVAVTMGIVPENERLLGVEGAGFVRRVGKGVPYSPGDRVVVFEKVCFANRIQVSKERAHLLPDSMSFKHAATLLGVYLTSLYALFNLANLRRGQSVLIQSAAGGIGISSIHLATYISAEIYVTVRSEEKRQFLHENFGIPYERMFSSRMTQFAAGILAATNGRGVDVILNSLTGELLDESWRVCADGGTMVEIGKKDVLDRNKLSMEPFDRNCSFRALDFSHKAITDALIADLMQQLFVLYEGGHVHPIHPIKVFPFEDIPAAFAYMRSGRHIGKMVISSGEASSVQVPVRPAPRTFDLLPDVAYLIVGGLRGLCGSLAIYMAQHGAKHIVAMSRSGCGDEQSQRVVQNCWSFDCEVYAAKGDVASWDDVLRTLQVTPVSVGGIIQGDMVLRDKPYEMMTVEEYHATISSKVQGAWNMHHAAQHLNLSLDFFTMLSSISGVVGQKGQANYAAANVFMDAFAVYRQSLGLRPS